MLIVFARVRYVQIPAGFWGGRYFPFYHPRSGVVKLCLSFCLLLLFLGRRLSILVPAFEPDTENDSVWASYFLTTPLQGCVRAFLFFLPNFEYLKKF